MAREKIVVIDDSPIVRKLAELALEEEGYKVYTAEDGEEGLRICEEVRPAIILVDFIMPRMSGYQFCETARDNEILKDIPIILITGKGEDVGKKFAEKFGVVDYFIKPFKSEILVEKVNAIVHSQKADDEEPRAEYEPSDRTAEPEADFYTLKTQQAREFDIPAAALPPPVAAEPPPPVAVAPPPPAAVEPPPPAVVEEITPVEPVHTWTKPSLAALDFNVAPDITEPLQTSSFDKSVLDHSPDFSDPYDFKAKFDMLRRPAAFDPGSAPDEEFSGTGLPEAAIDGIMRRYFSDELPELIRNNIEFILRQYGLIKDSSIMLSGSIQDVAVTGILKLISAQGLTGKFFAFSKSGSAEIYFEKGSVVFAMTSVQGRTMTSKRVAIIRKGTTNEARASTKDSIVEALLMIVGFRDGGFFFEKMDIPKAMLELNQRGNVMALILEGARRKTEKADETYAIGGIIIPVRSVSDMAASALDMRNEENVVFSLVDGKRSIAEIGGLGGLGVTETAKIVRRLEKAGVVADKGGL
jgi:CheY-like chemotaxis protein